MMLVSSILKYRKEFPPIIVNWKAALNTSDKSISVPISLYLKNIRNRYKSDENLEARHHEKWEKENKREIKREHRKEWEEK